MRERFKKTLTMQILQEDMTGAFQNRIRAKSYTGCATAVALLLMGILLAAALGGLVGLLVCMLALPAAGVLLYVSIAGRKTKAQPACARDIRLIRDRVTDKWQELINKRNRYNCYLIFENLGSVLTDLEDSQLGIHGCVPGYSTTAVGTSFFVAMAVNPQDSKRQLVFYPVADWRLRDLTPEQIAEEIRQEDDLIQRLIACNRFPQPRMRQEHFQESPHAFWVPWEKTREEQNVLDRFAVQYFNRDLVSALEFIELYCPWELQDAAQQQYSPAQYRLLELVEKYAETDKARQSRRERINEVKETLFRSDKYD